MSTMPRIFDPAPLPEGRLDAPAFHRNHEPIWSVLARQLANVSGNILETGSGTGQHVVEFARKSPGIVWWPSDYDARHLESIEGWRRHENLPNVRPPRFIDLAAPDWGFDAEHSRAMTNLAAIFCANVIHIAPWSVAEGLFRDAARRLRPGGQLFLYGPFKRDGQHTAPSNEAFDASLRARDPEWGVRDVADVDALARAGGLSTANIKPMPANNLILIFDRS